EPEIGFILKEDLEGPEVTALDVLRATEYVFPALEIIDSRYENFNFTLPDVIADNTSAAGAIFGTDLKRTESLELDEVGVILCVNCVVKALVSGFAELGHPAHTEARLANMLSETGEKVKASQLILTCGVTSAVHLSPGDFVHVKYGGIGDVSFFVTEYIKKEEKNVAFIKIQVLEGKAQEKNDAIKKHVTKTSSEK